jgi:lipocalin
MRSKRFAALLAAVSLSALAAACASLGSARPPLVLVPDVDPARYAGRWYEVARYDHAFERGLVGVTAVYELRPDGRIGVTNAGFRGALDGKSETVRAVARVPDPAVPGRLKVKFFNLFEADYLIIGLDEAGYSWAVVGENGRGYLWFLSRTPRADPAALDEMTVVAVAAGYDPSRLLTVPQAAGPE